MLRLRSKHASNLSDVTVMSNFPPTHSTVPRQWYKPDGDAAASAAALRFNAVCLSLQVKPSSIPGAGDGLFALGNIPAGAIIGYMWGKFIEEDSWISIKRGCDPTHRHGEEDFVDPVIRGIWCCISVDLQANGCDRLLASRQCPMAYLNHTDDKHAVNVSMSPPHGQVMELDESERYKFYPIRSTRAIHIGEELLTSYHWKETDWDEVRRRVKLALRVRGSNAVSRSQQSQIYSLMDDAFTASDAFEAQRRNLEKFYKKHRDEFDQLRYFPWTSPSLGRSSQVPLELRDSILIPGTQGVFLQQALSAATDGEATVVAPYLGFLIPDHLLEKFNELYHLPTAVRVPALDYYIDSEGDSKRRLVKMNIIGDPTHPGPIINDGPFSGLASNVKLRSIAKARVSQVMCGTSFNAQQLISSNVVEVFVPPGVSIGAGTELLLSYDDTDPESPFWNNIDLEAEYCCICFSKEWDREPSATELIQCEVIGCRASRHRGCFPAIAQMTASQFAAARFYCTEHIAAIESNKPLPLFAAASMGINQCPFTPPPPPPLSARNRESPPSAHVTDLLIDPTTRVASSSHPCVLTPPIRLDAEQFPNVSKPLPSIRLQTDAGPAAISASVFTPPLTRSEDEVGWQPISAARMISLLPQLNASAQPRSGSFAPASSWPVSAENKTLQSSLYSPLDRQCFERLDSGDTASSHRSSSDSDYEAAVDRTDGSSYSSEEMVSNFRGRISALSAAQVTTFTTSSEYPPITIRTEDATRKLPGFLLTHVSLSLAQRVEIQRMIDDAHATNSSRWFASSYLLSVHPQPASAAVDGKTKKADVNRWRDPHFIPYDYAEYRCCCGSAVKTAKLLGDLASGTAEKHSSLSVTNMFAFRLIHRGEAADQHAYRLKIQSDLSRAIKGQVFLDGGIMCTSCYRAVLGLGKTSMYAYKHASSHQTHKCFTMIGESRQPRQADRLEQAVASITELIQALGEHAPNPKGRNLKQRTIILPYTGQQACFEKLNEMVREKFGTAYNEKEHSISRQTMQRAFAHFQNVFKIHISVARSKDMCRCNECEWLDALIEESRKAKDLATHRMHQAQKKSHLRMAGEQRALFESYKMKAMLEPLLLWCITFDGMDQAKTKLPSRRRYAKDLDGLPRLGLHAVGAFCFGAPLRVLGIFNYPDVRKDSSLSVTDFERILDLQWQVLEAASPENPAARWPARLHLTFDNAAGEAKNQYFFKVLGLFVLHGVFEAITVSNLLVGHTHDIVDQMFSVWSKLLKIKNCATFESMSELFTEKYHHRVKWLLNLMRDESLNDGADMHLDEEAAQIIADARKSLDAEEQGPWSAKAVGLLEKYEQMLQADARVSPKIVLQSFSADIRRWLEEIDNEGGQSPDVKSNPALQHLANAHVFSIHRDEHVHDVYLYSKYLAHSHLHSHHGEQHHYMNEKTGSYSTRVKLWNNSDIAITNRDPNRSVAPRVDTNTLRQTFKSFRDLACLTEEEHSSLLETLASFDAIKGQNENACEQCKQFINELGDIGTVSRKKSLGEARLSEEKEKGKRRSEVQQRLRDHLQDAGLLAQHQHLLCSRWFTKWIDRSQKHIRPVFEGRGIFLPEEYVDQPYHKHPINLPSGPGEHRVLPSDERIVTNWLSEKGAPKLGDLIVLRGGHPREPVYLGQILEFVIEHRDQYLHKGQQSGQFARIHKSAAAAAIPAALSSAAASDSAPVPMVEAASGGAAAVSSTRQSRRTKAAVSYVDMNASSDDEPHKDNEEEAYESDIVPNSEEDKDDMSVFDHDLPLTAQSATEAAARSSVPLAAAVSFAATIAAPSSVPDVSMHEKSGEIEFCRTHRSDRKRKTNVDVGSLPSVRVHWWDMTKASAKNCLHFEDPDWDEMWWAEQHTLHGTEEPRESSIADEDSITYTPVAPWIVDLYQHAEFGKKPKVTDEDITTVYSPAHFILWGSRKNLLTNPEKAFGKFKAAIFNAIKADLIDNDATPGAAAAAAAPPKKQRRASTVLLEAAKKGNSSNSKKQQQRKNPSQSTPNNKKILKSSRQAKSNKAVSPAVAAPGPAGSPAGSPAAESPAAAHKKKSTRKK